MKVSFFIDRPVFSAVISIVIVIVGIIGLTMLPVDQYPQITPPVVKISASYPGASALTVEKRFIELGPEFGNNWVVERGLVAGEQIVTEGFHKLTPGMKVRAQAAVPKKEEEQTSDSLNKQVVSETKQTTPAENKSKDNNPSK